MKKASELLELLKKKQNETSKVYLPVVLSLRNRSHKTKFEKLLRSPGVLVNDRILDQVRELLKARNPKRKFSAVELEAAVQKHIGTGPVENYGVWVFYPWSNEMVHLLGKKEFIEVRTSRNQYKITPEERALLAEKKIGVVGLSVGQSVSVTLAMERIAGELRLADFDSLELTNLNRIRTGVHNLGLPKVYTVAREIAEIDPFIKVICYPKGLNEENLHSFFTRGGKLDLLIEESDGFDIKILSRYKARELRVPVLMEASDRCMVDVERFDLEPARAILHGIVKNMDVATLKKLKTNEEKIPYMLEILGIQSSSPRLRASMLEMQQTISTWPQLASAVTMGGGITADVSRRILLNHFTDSGRYYVDVEQIIGNKTKKAGEVTTSWPANLSADKLSITRMKEIAEKLVTKKSLISEVHLKKVAEAMRIAPSYSNLQPWKLFSHKSTLLLFFDKRCSSEFMDANHFNSYLSLGAAIENCVIRAAALGYECEPGIFPDGGNAELVALLRFSKLRRKAPEPDLNAFINKRHTNRDFAKPGDIPYKALEDLLVTSAKVKGAALALLTDRKKIASIAKICGVCEKIKMLHPKANREFFGKELKSDGGETREGLELKTLGLTSAYETTLMMAADGKVVDLLGAWSKGRIFENHIRAIVESTPVIGLISMPASTNVDFIDGGRVLQKLWLTATKNNLAFQPISVPLSLLKRLGKNNWDESFPGKLFDELKTVKKEFSTVFGDGGFGEPVALFRLFNAKPAANRSLKKNLGQIYFKS